MTIMGCPNCAEKNGTKHWPETPHETVGIPEKSQSMRAFRGVRDDYRTMRCTVCGYTQEWNFARD